LARADGYGIGCLYGLALDREWARRDAIPCFYRTVPAGLPRLGHLVISLPCAAVADDLGYCSGPFARSSQLFMLVGALFLMPFILGYTAYAYWLFRGKVAADEHY
jgi:cytochrome bd-type quinol oxidase subunit 2